MIKNWLTCSIILAGLWVSPAWAEAQPVFSPTGPEADAYGAAQGYRLGQRGVRVPREAMVGTYSGFDRIYPHHVVHRPAQSSPLRRAAEALSVTYRYGDQDRDLANYLSRHPVTGLLIAQGDTILFEHYQYARTDQDRFLSQSMAKTVTAMLLGIAVAEGTVRSIDQVASDYVPPLAGSAYGETTIRNLLHMASGVAFRETYDGTDDAAKLGRGLFGANSPGAASVLAQFNTREAEPGTRFHYASAETETLGLVVMGATGVTLARFLETRIWQPMGAEADATWTVDTAGQETAYCCMNAVLRDWARFGLMLAHDGAWHGRQIVPRAWVQAATTTAAPFLAVGVARRDLGYGYQTWLLPGPRRQFALLGIGGQVMLIDPGARLVLVHTAVRPRPTGNAEAGELMDLWRAVVTRRAGGSP